MSTNEVTFLIAKIWAIVSITILCIGLVKSYRTKKVPVEELEVEHETINNSNKIASKLWNEDYLLIAAFLASFYKTSNQELISEIAFFIGKSESSLIRKINRMRGHDTGKRNGISYLDIANMDYCKMNEEGYVKEKIFKIFETKNYPMNNIEELFNKSTRRF